MKQRNRLLLLVLVCRLFGTPATAAPVARRALLIGIDDYSASTLPRPPRWNADAQRGWPELKGAANDVDILREMLIRVYGFRPADIVVLKNQEATRVAILQAIDRHLIRPAAKGDIVFYYFAGHGAQVPNPLSDEPDRLDESIVPADSRHGTPDIRDKELRPLFQRILARGARLTLLLDHCHSGSSFRGLPTGARPRGIRPARQISDPMRYGPRPEEGGALVLASTQDPDAAWETLGEDGRMHGSFTWAWIRAMRDAAAGEPAQETFLRAQARMRAGTPYQAPAMLGSAEARLRPFLGARIDRAAGNRPVVAVEKVEADGSVVLQGGWANGLAVGTAVRIAAKQPVPTRLRITAILGVGRSVARAELGQALPQAVRSGALLEVVGWAAPPARPLRIWLPRMAGNAETIEALGRRFSGAGKARWVADPLEGALDRVLRPLGNGWELLTGDGSALPLASEQSAITAISRLRPRSTLFVQFPAPAALIDRFGQEGIVAVTDPREADYILVGRYDRGRLEYAWMRPLVRRQDRRHSGLPQRTAWVDGRARDAATLLRDSLLKLRRIHAWHVLEAPPGASAPYRLALRNEKTKELAGNGSVSGGDTYSVVLRPSLPVPADTAPLYYYAFAIDSFGKSYLMYPRNGSVENRFPLGDQASPDIQLGGASALQIMAPYGIDTYFLLATDEPLPNPSILEWNGVRAPAGIRPRTPLEELLLLTSAGGRGSRVLVTSRWSIERVVIESVAPRAAGHKTLQ